MKLLKKIVLLIVFLMLLGIIALASIMYFVDLNKMKTIILTSVNERSSFHLAIDDKLSWCFFPRPGVKIKQMTLTAPDQVVPFLTLSNVKVMPKNLLQLMRDHKNITALIKIANLNISNLRMQQAKLLLHLQENTFSLEVIRLNLYAGSLTGMATGQELKTLSPVWSGDFKISQVQLKPLLADASPSQKKLTLAGIADLNFNITTQGKTNSELLQHLNGSGEIRITDGMVEGLDLNYFIASANAWLNQVSKALNTRQTAFNSLTSSIIIKNGLVSTNNLNLVAPAFSALGVGKLDLNNQALDFQMKVKPLLGKKINISVPLRITGNLNRPIVRLDSRELRQIKDNINKIIPGAGKFLQNLLGN